MNEDKMILMLSNLDDDLIDKEIDNLMSEVEYDMESINRKAHQKLEKYNRKARLRKHLPYAAASACLCLICINTVYADEISQAVKSFFNKTPVYSTMVDGKAYYLESSLVLDDNLTIDSFMASENYVEMVCTSKLDLQVLGAMTVSPTDVPGAKYNISTYIKEDNNKYRFIFVNYKEKGGYTKEFQKCDLLVGGKTYSITLSETKNLDGTQKLVVGQAANQVDLVIVGANSIEKNGKQAVQLIASFKNKDIKLTDFGQVVPAPSKLMVKKLGKDDYVDSSTRHEIEEIYATDESETKHKLSVPADAQTRPISIFETDAVQGSRLTISLPALLATYENYVGSVKINIPKDGEIPINQDVDLVAQKAVIKSIKRLSPTSAELTFQLNTGADKYVSIYSFSMLSFGINEISAEFSGDQAIVILEFDQDVNAFELEVSYPRFIVNGNWTINLK